jgi:hypothetical protein
MYSDRSSNLTNCIAANENNEKEGKGRGTVRFALSFVEVLIYKLVISNFSGLRGNGNIRFYKKTSCSSSKECRSSQSKATTNHLYNPPSVLAVHSL